MSGSAWWSWVRRLAGAPAREGAPSAGEGARVRDYAVREFTDWSGSIIFLGAQLCGRPAGTKVYVSELWLTDEGFAWEVFFPWGRPDVTLVSADHPAIRWASLAIELRPSTLPTSPPFSPLTTAALEQPAPLAGQAASEQPTWPASPKGALLGPISQPMLDTP